MDAGRKSQLSISDLFLAASIFVILIGAIVFIYSHYTVKFESRQGFNRMQLAAMRTMDMLVKSEGVPSDWELNNTNAKLIGLAYSDRNLSKGKVDSFLNLSYNRTKELFRTDYEFYFKITDINGTVLEKKGNESEGLQAVGIERRIIYNNENAIMSLVLWK